MRKIAFLMVGTLLLAGCGTYTGSGAYVGGQFGSVLGSAIGGITGGPRGSDVGTIVGMVGGAAIGGAIGNSADKAKRSEVHDHYEKVQQRKAMERAAASNDTYDSGYDPYNGGDDRIYDFSSADYTSDYSAAVPRTMSPGTSSIEDISSHYGVNSQLQIRNARFVDENRDNALNSGETCKVIFEIHNTSGRTLFDIQPTVVESSGRKNIYISPSIHVEKLGPGHAIRYTAMVRAGKVKNGKATFCLSVLQGGTVMSDVCEFDIATQR